MALLFSSWWYGLYLVFVSISLYIAYYFHTSYKYWKRKGVICLKPRFPFGNLKDAIILRRSNAEEHQRIYNELKGCAFGGFYMLAKPRLMVRDPNLVKQILVKDFAYFHDRGIKVDEKRRPLSAHLLALSGKRWKNLRTKLTPTFTTGKMKMMFPIFVECSDEMNAKLEEISKSADVVDMKEIVALYTTDVIGSCAFGLQLNSMKNPDNEFRKFGKNLFDPSLLLSIVFLTRSTFPFIAVLLRPFLKNTSDFFLEAVRSMVKYREDHNVKRDDFLQLLIQLKNKGKVESDVSEKEDSHLLNDTNNRPSKENDIELTESLLAAQCFVFFLAGFETSSTTASFCLYELALNPDIQERLAEEVNNVLKEHDGTISYEAIQKMKYLDQVIDETLRKYPPGAVLGRECTTPYNIPGTGVTIDKGVQVFIPVFALHNDPAYFPRPEKFDPERFSDENKASILPFSYLPFGEGPRICIGMRFGLLQTKVGVAALLSKYKFSVCHKTAIPMKLNPRGFILSAKGGIWLKIERRN